MQHTLFQQEYDFLNDAQKNAVDTIYGPVMVVAGPGTGKTQIIGLRTANIILKTGLEPQNILITTFTEAGVVAIKKRLYKFIGNDAYKVNVSTIHSFSQDVIKTFPEKFLEYKASQPIDDVDQFEIFKEIIDKLVDSKKLEFLKSDYDKYFYLKDIKSRISKLKQEAVSINRLKASIKIQEESYAEELLEIKPTLKKYEKTREKHEKHINKLIELCLVFEEYNSTLRARSLYDFNDMINFVLEKFRGDEDLRYYYAEKFQFIMLDEYQDTNNAQNEIINLIINPSISSADTQTQANIMVVGDDDQSIYRFQGANIENMLDFSSSYKDTKFVVLENNYRSNQQILDTCQTLIQNNDERLVNKITSLQKNLISSGNYKGSKTPVKYFVAKSIEEEKTYIYENIKTLINKGTKIDDIAIIVRSNKEVLEYSSFLQSQNIEVESKLKTNILQNDYIRFILDYLDIIDNKYTDEYKFLNVIRSQIVDLNKIDILKINKELYNINYTKKRKIKLIDFFISQDYIDSLDLEQPEKIKDFVKILTDLSSKLALDSFSSFFNHFVDKIGILDYIKQKGSFDDTQDIFTLFNKIKDYNRIDRDFNLPKLLAKLDLYNLYNISIPRQILKTSKSGIQIMTAHSSKGLEFETVFVPGLYSGNWNNKRSVDRLKLPQSIVGEGLAKEVDSIEEDRRLFFVALSRAKQDLHLTFPMSNGNKVLLQSVFISEIEDRIIQVQGDYEKNMETAVVNILKNNLIQSSEEELEYIKGFLENYKLSPSDLNVFLSDPKEFLKRVIFKYPFVDNEFTIFGKVYHRSLELFYAKFKKEGNIPDKKYLLSIFEINLKKEILTPEEYIKLSEKGSTGLSGYYDLYSQTAKKPVSLEYNFRYKNIDFKGVPLTGKIDKIELVETKNISDKGIDNTDGQLAFFKETVALIDYKTGKIKTENFIKGKTQNSDGNYYRQLLFYKLMCELTPDFRNIYDVEKLVIDFVEGKDGVYKAIDITFEQEDFELLKNQIKDSWEKINDIDFWRDILNINKN